MATKYEKNEEGKFVEMRSTDKPLTEAQLQTRRAQYTAMIEAIDETADLSVEAVVAASQAFERFKDALNRRDLTWREVVEKVKAPWQAELDALNDALRGAGS